MTNPSIIHDPWRDAALATPDRLAFRLLSGGSEEGTRLERRDVTWAHLDRMIEEARAAVNTSTDAALFLVGWNGLSLLVHLVATLREGRNVGLLSPRIPEQELNSLAAQHHAFVLRTAGRDRTHDHAVPDGSGDRPTSRIILPDAGGTLIRTSGSTGAPRFIRHSAGQHMQSAAAVQARLGLGYEDSWLWSLPSFHVGGLSILWRMAVAQGMVVCAEPGISWLETLTADDSGRAVTSVSLVPTQLLDAVESGTHAPTMLRNCIVGGAALAPETLQSAVALGWPVRTTYGSTETASMVTLSEPWSSPDVPASETSGSSMHAGSALDGVSLRVDEGRIEINAPQIGEPWPPRAGIGLREDDGWMATSDSGAIDGAGRLQVHGRLDRVIISGGENLDLTTIEASLRKLDGVLWATVIGVADDRFGQRPVAFVRVQDAAGFDEQAMRESLLSLLEKPWIPDFVLLVPHDFDGIKPDNKTLQAWARDAMRHQASANKATD